ncbi:hypothetical protein [Spirosoma areae]
MNPTPIHPLVRQGTHQRERLLQALIPANLKLDDRTLADLIALVGQLATHIRYWPDSNTLPPPNDPENPEPTWEKFWQTDATPLLAVLAATDLVDLRSRYRSQELAYLRAEEDTATNTAKPDAVKPDDLLARLVQQIYDAARLTSDVYKKLPATHPLKAEFGRLIGEKLREPLRQLIAYHKGVATADLLKQYTNEKFIDDDKNKQPWGLASANEFRNGIQLQRPNNTDREPLWRLFLTFYGVLSVMVAKTGKSFQYALQSRSDHPPHVTLLLSFLHLFRYVQSDLNALPEKHLLFYYQDVLRLQQRGAIPDRTHVVFEMAQNLERYRLLAGTLFRGGTDRLSQERLYALETETVISKAKLVEQKSIYFLKNSPVTPIVQAKNATGLSARGVYEKLTGKMKRLENAQTDLTTAQPIVAGAVSDTNSKLSPATEQLARWETEKETYEARPGLLIASPELWMEQSEGRRITLTFDEDISALPLSIQLSTADSLHTIDNEVDEATAQGFDQFIEKQVIDNDDSHEAPNTLAGQEPAFLKSGKSVFIYLPASFPALKPYRDNPDSLLTRIQHPFMLLQPRNPQDYGDLKDFSFNSVRLQTASRGIKKLTLQLGDTEYPANADIPLVGATADVVTSYLYLSTPEISLKTIPVKPADLTLPTLKVGTADVLQSPEMWKNGAWVPLTGTPESIPNYDYTGGPLHYSPNSEQTFLRVKVVIPKPATNKDPVNTVKIAPESILFSYVSTGVPVNVAAFSADDNDVIHRFYYYLPFGGLVTVKKGPVSMAPNYLIPSFDVLLATTSVPAAGGEDADGNLLLGFENLVPNQTLSVLFRMQEGTGNPDKIAPEIVWSYYRENLPVRLPQHYILIDETDGLSRTGIIRFQIPTDITTGIMAVPGEKNRLDLCWLMASATEAPAEDIAIEALPLIDHIHAQAATVVFQNHKNTLEHLVNGLPANTISQLRTRDVNVRKVIQPYASAEGRLPESTDALAYYRRISERLRHKQRAITVWDYERLVLEEFPKIAVVKCLPHTEKDDLTAPGYVTLAVIPNPDVLTGEGRFYPSVGTGDRKAIAAYLNRHNSFFVSGVGGFVPCCCHDDDETPATEEKPCGCPPKSRLQVVNARFEPVRLQVCVRFYKGKDIPLHKKLLNDALKLFLAPWTRTGGPPVAFGVTIKTTQLLRFLENLDYVDVVMSIKVKHFASKEEMLTDEPGKPWAVADSLQPFTARSVLTTYVNILDEANPNALDHEINVLDIGDPCHCSACVEEALIAWIKGPVDSSATPLKAFLDKLVDSGELVGQKVDFDPATLATKVADELAKEFNGAAYWFKLDAETNPTTISLALATHPHAPFVKRDVIKPPILP